MAHTCKNCGVVSDDPSHLCNPIGQIFSCSHCGASDVSANHVCRQKLAAIKYSCQSCGRVAMDGADLCKPHEIG